MMAAAIASSRAATRASMQSGGHAGYSFRRSRSHGSSGEPSSAALLSLAVVATGLVIGGIWYLMSAAEGNRERLEQQYESAVDRWQQSRRYFGDLQITASTRQHLITLKTDTKADKLYDSENAFNLPTYEALSFVARGVPPGFMPAADFESLQSHTVQVNSASVYPHTQTRTSQQEWGPSVSLALKLEDKSGFGSTVVETRPFPVVRALIRNAPTPAPDLKCKRELQGLFKAGKCWIFSKLSSICVQVSKDPSSSRWRLVPRHQGHNESYGCDYASGEWAAPHYERVPAAHAKGLVGFDNLTIQVRSADDPYLSALDLTHGALDFGMTASDDRAVGLVMLLLGLVVACPPSYAAYKAYYGPHSARELPYATMGRRRPHDDEDTEMYGGYAGFESEGFEMR